MAAAPRYAQNLALITRFQAGDRDAAEALLALNEPLVVKIAARYAPFVTGMEFDDLLQEGRLGLLHAAARFDVNRGYQFSTYCTHWIRQGIGRAISQQDRLIRIPDHRMLQIRAGVLEAPEPVLSLDALAGDSETTRLEELLPAADDPEAEALARLEAAAALERLAVLTARERAVLLARAHGWPLREVGAQLGLSREGVRTVERRARGKVAAEGPIA